jgi:hypothetical protein
MPGGETGIGNTLNFIEPDQAHVRQSGHGRTDMFHALTMDVTQNLGLEGGDVRHQAPVIIGLKDHADPYPIGQVAERADLAVQPVFRLERAYPRHGARLLKGAS